MSHFGNVPAQALVDAVEKHVAKMDDAELASILCDGLPVMGIAAVTALVRSMFEAFRDRGESSEDAAEGANSSLTALEAGESDAVASLIGYACENAGLLKETMTHYAEQHGSMLSALPRRLLDGIGERVKDRE